MHDVFAEFVAAREALRVCGQEVDAAEDAAHAGLLRGLRAHDELVVLRSVPTWEVWSAYESWAAAVDRLTAAGVEIVHIDTSAYFRDPDGYVIELAAKRPEHDARMNPETNGARTVLATWQDTKPR